MTGRAYSQSPVRSGLWAEWALTLDIVARLGAYERSPHRAQAYSPPSSSAPDRPGLVAAVADFIYRIGGDVTQADQHNDEEEGMFFQRVEFRVDGVKLVVGSWPLPSPRWLRPSRCPGASATQTKSAASPCSPRASPIAWWTSWAAGTRTSCRANRCWSSPTTLTTPSWSAASGSITTTYP